MATGFRSDEVASLTPASFDLAASPPVVVLGGRFTKNGKTATQPLPPFAVARMKAYLAGRRADARLWPGAWHSKSADMVRADLKAAGIPFVVQTPDGPRYADFHALRHTFIYLLDKSGATLKEAMQLARHSDPKLTMAVYGRSGLADLGTVVGRFPLGDRAT